MKLCKDCEHYGPRINLGMYVIRPACRRPLSTRVDPVSGEFSDRLDAVARNERKPGKTLFGRERCGPEAKFFSVK